MGGLVVDSFNESYKKGKLTNYQRQAVITLLVKKDKNRAFLHNWRPISLLNIDNKIASKAIAQRIQKVLPSIIHSDQCGYVSNRQIGDAVRTIADVMEYTKKHDLHGLMIFIDFKKAFDSLNWNYMHKCLDAFNFGPTLTSWVHVFYNNISSCIMNGRFTSGHFNVTNGVRQGDPLSPYLFILALETLATTIRSEANVEGIRAYGKKQKIILYADDITAMLPNIKSAKALFTLLKKFENSSGLKVNSEKTEAMWLGSSRLSNKKSLGISWPQKPIKVLGVFFSYDEKLSEKANFENKIKSLKSRMNIWRSRGLIMYGRIMIVKTLGISEFLYIASLINVPEWVINTVESAIYGFVWKGKKDRIKRTVLINNFRNAGLNMVDIRSKIASLKANVVKRFFENQSDTLWKDCFTQHLNYFGGKLLFQCDYDVKCLGTEIPAYYLHVLECWKQFYSKEILVETIQSLSSCIVWNNSHIQIEKKIHILGRFL